MTKRILLFALVALSVFLVGALSLNGVAARDRALAEADRALAARARFFADALDRTLQQRLVSVFTFAALPSLRGFAASDEAARPARMAIARVELYAMLAADPNLRAVSIVDAAGTVILTTDSSMFADWSARAFVRDALAGKLHASPPARELGEISQFYSAPILNNFGDVAGALVVRVVAQELWDVLRGETNLLLVDEYSVRIADRSETPQHFVALMPLEADAAARVLAQRRYGVEVTQIRATRLVELADAIRHATAAQIVYRDATGQTIRAATQYLTTKPWTLIAFEREDAILAPARELWLDQIKIVILTAIVAAGSVYAAQAIRRRDTR